MKKSLIVILGPTASGKSDLAVEIARMFNGEVVSADSRQVYKGLDIGTGKITKKEMRGILHHLLDVVNPKRRFFLPEYQKQATQAIDEIQKRGKTPILCGGTGFYIQSIVDGIIVPEVPPNEDLRKKLSKKSADELFMMLKKFDPKRAKSIDAKNPVRLIRAIEIARALGSVPKLSSRPPSYNILQIGIDVERDELKEKITKRLAKRLRIGMVAEATHLHEKGLSWKRMRELGLDYRALADLITKKTNLKEFKEVMLKESMDYAKRQMVWFKRDKKIRWFKLNEKEKIIREVRKFLK
ncbi:MAG: tRNA (adenosine(37)-N6)-dimethylallyltransferase MiaA [Patescibacteria group bacterium]